MRKTLMFAAALGAALIQYACYLNPFGGLGSSGGGGGGGSGSGVSTNCTPSGLDCRSGETESACAVIDNGACASTYFTLGAQTFPCVSCDDTTACAQAAAQACTGSSSGGDDAGSPTCTPGTCNCINSGPYACGSTCYSTAAEALQACIFSIGIPTCTECTTGGSGSGGSSGSGSGSSSGSSSSGGSGGPTFIADCVTYYDDYSAGGTCVACLQNHACPADTGLPACESECSGTSGSAHCSCIESCLGSNAATVDTYYSCVTGPCGGSCP